MVRWQDLYRMNPGARLDTRIYPARGHFHPD
jgi:hypothetical protein